jgi:hypothetical protein
MASQPQTSFGARRAFQPDLRDAQLEDRPLLASIVPAFPPLLDGNALFGFYIVPLGGFFGLSGGGGATGATTGSGPGSSVYTGGGTIGGLLGSLFGVLQSPAQAAQVAPAPPSSGSLLGLPSSYSPSTNAGAVHNNGPIGGGVTAGFSDSFSSGGNFAASYTGTYNGFANSTNSSGASGGVPRAPQRAGGTPPPANGQPANPRLYQINPPPNNINNNNDPTSGDGVNAPMATFSAPVLFEGPGAGGNRSSLEPSA